MMKVTMLIAGVAASAAQQAPGPLQQLVDSAFKRYLTPEQNAHACPFVRIAQQCEQFNETVTESKACHVACPIGDFQCHLKCPSAKPTSVQELVRLGSAMACHKACGKNVQCHKMACGPCPFKRKRTACGKLAEVVECHKKGGDHTTCKLDDDAKELLLAEPWSLVKDVADHVVDHVLPPAEQPASWEEVHKCHMGCGHDGACHRACPSGQWGVLKEQCASMDAQKECHQSCKAQEIKCPFKKMSCHMKCPMSMPSSVEELKATADHIACHTECGQGSSCHKSCPISKQWTERKAKCTEFDKVAACHKGCDHSHECHTHCPSMHFEGVKQASAGNLAKEIVDSLLI